jgi:hypothetical protein
VTTRRGGAPESARTAAASNNVTNMSDSSYGFLILSEAKDLLCRRE